MRCSHHSFRGRRGKLDSLPFHTQLELNRRFWDGESHAAIAAWLNSLPSVQKLMAKEFDGQAINRENLSAWYQGEYVAFLELVREMAQCGPEALRPPVLGNALKGKIARLPRAIQTELCERMWKGETFEKIADWINAHPDAIARMRDYFGGASINLQNLSEWRQTGYAQWLGYRHLAARTSPGI